MPDFTPTSDWIPVSPMDDSGSVNPARICVIDLGTNSFHTVIVDVYPNGVYKELDRIKEMVRLGEQGMVAHCLTDEAMQRGVEALGRIQLLADGWGVQEYMAYATSAIREARNGGDFIERAQMEVGIHIKPISGTREATLIYKGVQRAVDLPAPALLVDIGGGSTEFIVGDSREVFFATSLKLGAARMTEQFVKGDPVEAKSFKALREYYRKALAPVFEAARRHSVREIIGSSGTMENLAMVQWGEGGAGDGERTIFQRHFDAKDFRRITKRVMRSTRDERLALSGIDERRVDQVVAGAMLVDVLIKDLSPKFLRISPHALREGMVVHFIERNDRRLNRLAPFSSVRRRSVYEIGFRFRWEYDHTRQVTALALQLFDALAPLHRLGDSERELLEYAALLHDIGYHVSHRSHHKHALYLIRQADLRGFQPEEIQIIANVARYHRRSPPKKTHPDFEALAKSDKETVRKMAVLLRLAEGLERSHYQNVIALRCRIKKTIVKIAIRTRNDPQLETWGARHAAAVFEATFGRRLEVESEEVGS